MEMTTLTSCGGDIEHHKWILLSVVHMIDLVHCLGKLKGWEGGVSKFKSVS
jgi:hypothetical protein